MSKDAKEQWILSGVIGFVILGIIALGMGWSWYRAGVQAEVYQREGIHMTQWEVWLGSKPAERTINVK